MKSRLLLILLGATLINAACIRSLQATTYTEMLRPQFHFTAGRNWLNDPNGCVFADGEYHLFFQHNPTGNEWGNMTWGHAVSPDLVHWQQLSDAIAPYDDGTIFSGSAVLDKNNSCGLGVDGRQPLVAMFTHARKPFGQALASSVDNGRTWKLFEGGKHVVPNQGLDEGERDPRVFWHQPTSKWVMVLWVKEGTARFFTSDDLKTWTHASDFTAPGFFECPDIFELPLGDSTKWVLCDAAFNCWVGMFDGKSFKSESGPIRGDLGRNFYATQTWTNTGSRVIQIAWMRDGKYPGMPFNQQMTFPCELSLRHDNTGYRICRNPIKEISSLYGESAAIHETELRPGANPLKDVTGDVFDIEMTIEPREASNVALRFHDQVISYSAGSLSCLGTTAPLALHDRAVKLRLLIDRTSIELFGNDGEVSISTCFVPKSPTTALEIAASGAPAYIKDLKVRKLRSAWNRLPGKD